MAKLIVILVVATVFEAIGVALLSRGLKQIGEPAQMTVAGVAALVGRGFMNPNVVSGVFFEAIFFVGLLILMSKADVTFIWPLTSLSFVMTTLTAKFMLREEVPGLRWAGVSLIMMGAALITYTEKVKERERAAQPQTTVGQAGPKNSI